MGLLRHYHPEEIRRKTSKAQAPVWLAIHYESPEAVWRAIHYNVLVLVQPWPNILAHGVKKVGYGVGVTLEVAAAQLRNG